MTSPFRYGRRKEIPPRRQKVTEEKTFESFAKREAEKEERKRNSRRRKQIRKGELLSDGDDGEIQDLIKKMRGME